MLKCLCPLRRQIWDILTSRDLLPTLTITQSTREKNTQSSLMNEWMQFASESDHRSGIINRNIEPIHWAPRYLPDQAVTHAHDRAYIYHVHMFKGMIKCTWLSTSSPAILMLTLLITWPSMLPWSLCVTGHWSALTPCQQWLMGASGQPRHHRQALSVHWAQNRNGSYEPRYQDYIRTVDSKNSLIATFDLRYLGKYGDGKCECECECLSRFIHLDLNSGKTKFTLDSHTLCFMVRHQSSVTFEGLL